MEKIVIGIDIGGTFSKYGMVTRSGTLFNEGSVPSDRHPDIKEFVKYLKKEVLNNFDETKYKLKGIGIGVPNGNYYTGTIEHAPNLKWKGIIDLAGMVEKEFGVKTVITNDANAAALGEMIYGDARHMQNFIMITLGTGLGSGIIVNGDLVYGHDGFAGEIGHTTVYPDGRICGCGKKGCLETYASVTGIERTVTELLSIETIDSSLRDISFNNLDGKIISEAAAKGDKIALKAFDITGKILGMKLADSVAHVSPEAIFLFGGLTKAGDLIFNPVKKYLEKYLLPVYKNKVKVLPSGLIDQNIAVLGASALMWKEFDKTGNK